jgi:hypothetical protein
VSKAKAREFLARLKALEDEIGVHLEVEGCEYTSHLRIDDDVYTVTFAGDHCELREDRNERRYLSRQLDIATDPFTFVAGGTATTNPTPPVVELRYPLLEPCGTPFLRMYGERPARSNVNSETDLANTNRKD